MSVGSRDVSIDERVRRDSRSARLTSHAGGPQTLRIEGAHPNQLSEQEADQLDHVAVQKLDCKGRWYVLPVDQIAYVFLGSRAALQYIHAGWLRGVSLETGDVYVRTTRGVTTRTDFRQFTEIEVRLDQPRFMLVNRALMVNLRRIAELDVNGKIKQLGIAVGDQTEWPSTTRTFVRAPRVRRRSGPRIRSGPERRVGSPHEDPC